MLIVAGRAWTNRFCAQAGIEYFPMQVGKFLQERLGLGGRGENASDRCQRESAKADGPLEGGKHVVTPVMGD